MLSWWPAQPRVLVCFSHRHSSSSACFSSKEIVCICYGFLYNSWFFVIFFFFLTPGPLWCWCEEKGNWCSQVDQYYDWKKCSPPAERYYSRETFISCKSYNKMITILFQIWLKWLWKALKNIGDLINLNSCPRCSFLKKTLLFLWMCWSHILSVYSSFFAQV